jgi:hypothetical protein
MADNLMTVAGHLQSLEFARELAGLKDMMEKARVRGELQHKFYMLGGDDEALRAMIEAHPTKSDLDVTRVAIELLSGGVTSDDILEFYEGEGNDA